MTRPPFPYFGGKQSTAAAIIAKLPPHRHYVEPFAGSLAVLLAKGRAPLETVNDLDGYVMTFWRVLRDRPEDLARACALTPHSRAEHLASYDLRPQLDELEVARRVWVRLSQGRAGTLRQTGWRYFRATDVSVGMPAYLAGYVDRISAAAERLAGVSLESMPALDLIRSYGAHSDALIYADPPYLGTTRGYGDSYRVEHRSESEHRELADALRGCRAAVVLSGYASDLYDRELFPDWHRAELQTQTGNGAAGRRGRTEVLWSNRPFPGESLTLFEVG